MRTKAAVVMALLPCVVAAEMTVFFDSTQVATLVASNSTSDTIRSEGYEFTYTRDKLFTGGVGLTNPVGRLVRVPWPDGVEAQYVTAGPTPGNARITLRRTDRQLFDLISFTAMLLANAGAGRAIEIVPLLNGEEPLKDPFSFVVSGVAGNHFSYDTSLNPLGSTAALTNYDAYVINLSLDYVLTAVTLQATLPATNHAPTAVSLSLASVPENMPIGTPVGTLYTADPDAGDAFTYALVGGAGSSGNGLFSVSGSDLLTAASFNYEVQSNYTVRVQSQDQGLLSVEQIVPIDVIDVFEPPPVLQRPAATPGGGLLISWSSIANHAYAVQYATNLLSGFSVLQTDLVATPPMNTYTDSAPAAAVKFWKVTTGP